MMMMDVMRVRVEMKDADELLSMHSTGLEFALILCLLVEIFSTSIVRLCSR